MAGWFQCKKSTGLLDRFRNNDAFGVKMNGYILEEKPSFKMLRLNFFSKLDWDSHIISIAKTASKIVTALIRSLKFLFPEAALYLSFVVAT